MTHDNEGPDNRGDQFARLPRTEADRTVSGRPTRSEVVSFFSDRYGIPSSSFDAYTFWEKGKGKIWAFRGDTATPIAIEALGMHVLRTRQEHWKPTTNAVQRFGQAATKNVLVLEEPAARTFWRGGDQRVDWDGDWGYLIVAVELVGRTAALGVGLYIDGTLRSVVPKSRQRELDPLPGQPDGDRTP